MHWPGGTGSSSKLTSFPALWARIALWYCCSRGTLKFRQKKSAVTFFYSHNKQEMKIHCSAANKLHLWLEHTVLIGLQSHKDEEKKRPSTLVIRSCIRALRSSPLALAWLDISWYLACRCSRASRASFGAAGAAVGVGAERGGVIDA